MMRLKFEVMAAILMAGIAVLATLAFSLAFLLTDRESTAQSSGPEHTLTARPESPRPLTLQPSQPSASIAATAVPAASGSQQPSSLMPTVAPAFTATVGSDPLQPSAQGTPLLPADHPTVDTAQPCAVCHNPHGGG